MEGVVSFKAGKYKGLDVPKPRIIITEEEIKSSFIRFIDPHLKNVLKDDHIEIGDYIQICYEIKDENGNVIPNGKIENFNTRLGYGYLNDDFEKHLVGLKKGDAVKFAMTMSSDFEAKELQNQKVNVSISVLEVKQKEKIEITDEYIESLGLENIKTISDVRADIRDKLYYNKLLNQGNNLVNEIVAKLLDDCTIEYDEDVVNYYAHEAFEQYVDKVNQNSTSSYLGYEHDEKFREEMISKYKEETKTTLLELALFNSIIERENIALGKDEKNSVVESYCLRNQKSRESVNVNEIKKALLYKKVLEFLVIQNTI
ncbi:FKBP-type peptidyl-prolyl cis-trans isomerase [Wukongibacter baidiensis]|uniref:FKBP-type peptidyl-prolyl cis-trans isomerase n=1 Tax=Wukongibacter baidiensis TaxID=1723361 RepID=UPI003D7F8723